MSAGCTTCNIYNRHIIRPVRSRGYITGDNSKVIMFGGQIPGSHLPQLATGPPLPALDVGHARLLQRRQGGGEVGGGCPGLR